MITLQTADKALKSLYLGVVSDQLNTKSNAFLTKIQHTTSDVWGKNIVKMVPYGLNGGIGAGTETGNLPNAASNQYAQFTLSLKNLYGTIEISDKAIRASENNAGAFVNLLNAEMEGLLKASKFNFSRMLYGNGSGRLAYTVDNESNLDKLVLTLDSTKNVMEGMVIDIYATNGSTPVYAQRRITYVDRAAKTIKIDGSAPSDFINSGYYITVQNSKDAELTGLNLIFATTGSIYGLARTTNRWLIPYIKNDNGPISSSTVQTAIDFIDEVAGSEVDFISAAYDVRRFYLDYLALSRTNVDYMNLDGGFKALSYNGIPFMADRFVEDGSLYVLNSKDFKIHQLCDWRWLEGENGKILSQKAGTPTYSATLVKYADLLCEKPIGQAKIMGITAATA